MSGHQHRTPERIRGRSGYRGVHLVGSLPAEVSPDPGAALQWILERAGTEATGLPFDRDPNWVCQWLDALAALPALKRVRRGNYTGGYTDRSLYRVRHRQRLTPPDLALGRVAEVRAALQAYDALDADLPQLLPPLQVSVPSPLDRALFAFLPEHGLLAQARGALQVARALRMFTDATRSEIFSITEVLRGAGRPALLQLESPAILGAFARTPRLGWAALAHWLARHIVTLISAAPPEIAWVLHLCRGDFNKTAWTARLDLDAVVAIGNAVADLCAEHGWPMPELGVPFAGGDDAPNTDQAFYLPLRRVRRDIEAMLGRPASAVSRCCGYGRCSVADTTANIQLCRELAAEPPALAAVA
jgi:hypothetical protein